MIDKRLEQLLIANRAAVSSFGTAALAIGDDAFAREIESGKWSPAAHADHVARAYAAAVADIEHGQSMRLLGTARQRRLWRFIGLNVVRWLGRLPRAKAPREIRPHDFEHRSRAQLLRELDERVRSFEAAVRHATEVDAHRRFMHPYFGALDLHDGVRLIAVHTRHHARVLDRFRARVAPSAGANHRH